MASPIPKPKEQRRRYNQPARGEWVDLEPLEAPVLPEYNPDWATWTSYTDDGPKELESGVRPEMWEAWREDPVTSQYSSSDIAAACYLAERFFLLSDNGRHALMDKLGLTPKGKRDLRWRTPNEVKTIKKAEEKANVRKLHAVGNKSA